MAGKIAEWQWKEDSEKASWRRWYLELGKDEHAQGKARRQRLCKGLCEEYQKQFDFVWFYPALCCEISSEYWKDWCWSWNSNTLATWCKELTHWKRPSCWERLKVHHDGRDWRWKEKGTTEDEMTGWHHRFHGHEFEQALEVGDRQGSLVFFPGITKSWTELSSDWAPELCAVIVFGIPLGLQKWVCILVALWKQQGLMRVRVVMPKWEETNGLPMDLWEAGWDDSKGKCPDFQSSPLTSFVILSGWQFSKLQFSTSRK